MKKKFQHTPDSAARAIRTGYDTGRLGRLAKTLADYDEQNAAREEAPAQRPVSGPWLNTYQCARLVCEQVGEKYATADIIAAIEKHFPELFADYWENLFAAAKSA